MIEIITTALIAISFIASMYYLYAGFIKPETLMPYAKANIPRWGIQLLSVLLGIGGLLLLFPQTFVMGGILLMIHSLFTIVCYVILNDWKGGFFEMLMLLIPVFMLWAGYPLFVVHNDKKEVGESKTEKHAVSFVAYKTSELYCEQNERSAESKIVEHNKRQRQCLSSSMIVQQTGKGHYSIVESEDFELGTGVPTIPMAEAIFNSFEIDSSDDSFLHENESDDGYGQKESLKDKICKTKVCPFRSKRIWW